jgi:hypothetical protein
VSVVWSLLVTSSLVMLGCFPVVASGMRQMFVVPLVRFVIVVVFSELYIDKDAC